MTIIEVPGPTGDAVKDTAAIKAAIQQANEAYLKDPLKAQVRVQLKEGTYVVTGDKDNPSFGPVELLSGVELTGFGTRGTTIKLEDHFDARINGIVRTALTDVENVTVSNLVIDGNRANNQGHQAGFICGIKENADGEEQRNITIDGVEVMNCTAYGINPHEITYNMVVKNSVAHNNGLDGFVADAVIGGTYENNVSYDNDRHGFNIQNATKDLVLKNNEAYENGFGINPATGLVWGGAGITIQRGNIPPEGSSTIPWVTNIQITGGSYHGNNKEGILVKLSDKVTIDGVDVYGNLRQGVRIEGSTNTTLQDSEIYNNSQELHNEYDEVSIRLRNDFTDGTAQKFPYTYYSTDTQILNNTIYANGQVKARYGIREEPTNDDGGATRTTLQNNTVTGMATGGISVPNYSEVITGTAENDVIAGSTGGEQMKGLGGDDTYTVNHSKDVIVEVAGEGANDHVLSSITYTLTANVEHLTLEGAKVSVDGKGINGYGNELANRITGNHLANELNGLDGNDTLDGGGGNDILDGGNGNDTYRVDSTGDVIVEKASSGLGGVDTVESTVSYTLFAQVENLFLMGSANIDATGNSGANRLTGNSGNNVLNGLGGSDLMTGGLGNDTYYVDHTGDVVSEADGGGTDTVYSSVSLTLGQFVENLILQATAVTGTGNTLNNAITGNDIANKLSGGAGNDTLSGGVGNDTLDGGADTDTAVYAGTRASFTISGTTSERTVAGSSTGADTLRSIEIIQFSDGRLVGNVWEPKSVNPGSGGPVDPGPVNPGPVDPGPGTPEQPVVTTVSGDSRANTVRGDSNANIVKGLGGNDRVYGGAGDDKVYGGSGNDRVYGDAGNDWVYGDSGSDRVYGGSGNDRVNGGSGNDILSGSTGSDVFVFSSKLGTASTDRKVNFDTISDFNVKYDSLWLDNAIFKKLGSGSTANPGTLSKGFFTIGSEAKDKNDYLIYNKKTGVLSYDADGSGSKEAVEFAQLKKGLALSYKDIFIV